MFLQPYKLKLIKRKLPAFRFAVAFNNCAFIDFEQIKFLLSLIIPIDPNYCSFYSFIDGKSTQFSGKIFVVEFTQFNFLQSFLMDFKLLQNQLYSDDFELQISEEFKDRFMAATRLHSICSGIIMFKTFIPFASLQSVNFFESSVNYALIYNHLNTTLLSVIYSVSTRTNPFNLLRFCL